MNFNFIQMFPRTGLPHLSLFKILWYFPDISIFSLDNLFYWWLIRVTSLVAFGFLSKNSARLWGPTNGILLVFECSLSSYYIHRWLVHSNPICCYQIGSNVLVSQVVRMLKHCFCICSYPQAANALMPAHNQELPYETFTTLFKQRYFIGRSKGAAVMCAPSQSNFFHFRKKEVGVPTFGIRSSLGKFRIQHCF